MSLSNPVLTNPAKRRFEWAGSAGKLQYYDRETKATYEQPLPFRFIVLDQLNTIAGFSKPDQSRIWANEVRNLKNDELYTRMKNGPIEAGLYENLKRTPKMGGKFCKSVYIAFLLNGNWVIGNMRLYGSSMTSWFDFTKSYSVEQGLVVMSCGQQMEAQTGPYFPPVYQWEKWDHGAYEVAVELDRELQIFLNQYLAQQKVDEEGQGTETAQQTPGYATPEQQEHYNNLKAAGLSNATPPEPVKQTADTVIEDIGDEPINLDDIPF